MTVTEFMTEYHITKTNFYRALKAHDINPDDLREPESKHLSAAGTSTLAAIFAEQMNAEDTASPDAQKPTEKDATTPIDNSYDAVELAVLRERVSGLQRENDLLRQESERLRDEVVKAEADAEEWKRLFTDMHEAQQRLLEAPKPSILERIFSRHRKEKI